MPRPSLPAQADAHLRSRKNHHAFVTMALVLIFALVLDKFGVRLELANAVLHTTAYIGLALIGTVGLEDAAKHWAKGRAPKLGEDILGRLRDADDS